MPALPASTPRRMMSGYDSRLFIDHQQWDALMRILDGRGGGSYGLSGPRGAGKSWMMEKARFWAGSEGGLGVPFPSPSEYEATAFLAALSDVTAARFEQDYDQKTGQTTKASRRRYLVGMLIVVALFYAATLFVIASVNDTPFTTEYVNAYTVAASIVAAAGIWVLVRTVRQFQRDREGLGRVRRAAEELRQQVRFVVTTKESFEVGAEAKQVGLGALLKRASERQLAERPATLSSLIHNFRAFAESMAVSMPGPIVIAVDELDKMSDAARVAALLRDIKGVFEIPGVYFLVSLSDEAARSLELGAVRTRNEFNSSFYTVISLAPLTGHQAVALLRRRVENFDEQLALAIGVLTGGIPREIVRVADAVYEPEEMSPSTARAVVVAMGDEVEAFMADVLSGVGDERVGTWLRSEEKLALWRRVSTDDATRPDSFPRFALGLIAAWDLNDASPVWRELHQEQWRRLIIRLAVAGLIVGRLKRLDDCTALSHLQEVVRIASGSAAVARVRLVRYMIGEMRCIAEGQADPDDDEVAVAVFLLGRRGERFTNRNSSLRGHGTNRRIEEILVRFRDYGIVERQRTGLTTSWKLANTASRTLGLDEPTA